MRLQVEEGALILRAALLILGGILLAVGLARLALVIFDSRTLLCMVAGLLPLLFLRGNILARYLGSSVTLAGAVGAVVLLGNWAKCSLGSGACVHYESLRILIGSGAYALLLVIGVRVLWRLPRNSNTSSPQRT